MDLDYGSLPRRTGSPLCCSISMEDLSVLKHNYVGSHGSPSSFLTHTSLLQHRSYSDTVCDIHTPSRKDIIRKLKGEDKENLHQQEDTQFVIEIPAVTLVDEIMAKYGHEQGFYTANSPNVIFGKTSPCKQLPGKRSAAGCLELIVLNERGITRMGDLQTLAPLVQHVTELDLAKNSITDWQQVMDALSVMPLVYHCNLSLNLLDRCAVPVCPPMSNMNRLVLNGTQVPWESLCVLLEGMHNLEELHLSLNTSCARNIPVGHSGFPSVRVVHMSVCDIDSWTTLTAICALFPSLFSLTAADNPLRSVEEGDCLKCVNALRHLNLNRCLLSDWSYVDSFSCLPNLTDLRITGNPIVQHLTEDESRMHALARLSGLTRFNGSIISDDIRLDSERAFIRHCFANDVTHPNLVVLESLHGQVLPLVEVDLTPKEFVNVMVLFEEYFAPHKLNMKHTVGQCKKALCKLLNVGVNEVDFLHKAMDVEEVTLLRLNTPSLASLKIMDNDHFLIMRKLHPGSGRRK